MVLVVALITVLIISLLGITGGVLLIYREKWAKLTSKYLITFAIGTLFGVTFLDLLPESIASLQSVETVLIYTLSGIILFYLLEKTLLWYHHHSIEQVWHKKHPVEEKAHPVGYLITFGDALHNFIDGLVMSAGFLIDIKLGITTSLAVLFHELPQEIGEFAVLLHAKFSKAKIILYSLAAQMTAIVGALLGFFYLPLFENLNSILLAIAAGGFIYIASTDLLPETHREEGLNKSLLQILLLIFGILVIWYIGRIFSE
ncbi:MAG: ZIP family metal transporter [Candidatus Aenigmatarchaeota archaeon]